MISIIVKQGVLCFHSSMSHSRCLLVVVNSSRYRKRYLFLSCSLFFSKLSDSLSGQGSAINVRGGFNKISTSKQKTKFYVPASRAYFKNLGWWLTVSCEKKTDKPKQRHTNNIAKHGGFPLTMRSLDLRRNGIVLAGTTRPLFLRHTALLLITYLRVIPSAFQCAPG